MHQLRIRFRLALLLATLLTLSACGSDGGPASTDKPTASKDNEAQPETELGFYLGQPLDDVSGYLGVYGNPGAPDELRGQFFVAEAKRPKFAEQAPEIPRGYLSIGAMWGDVAPYNMKSLSPTRFEHVNRSDFAPPEPIVAEFEMGPDGRAVALTFPGGFSEFGRLQRLRDLPAEWR